MTIFPLLAVGFVMKVVAAIFLICSVALILIILIQKGRGGGLSAAFGGAMASGILGSKTGDFLTWVTIVLVSVFLTLAVVMARFYKPTISSPDTGVPRRTALPTEQAPSPEMPAPISDISTETSGPNQPDDTNLPSS